MAALSEDVQGVSDATAAESDDTAMDVGVGPSDVTAHPAVASLHSFPVEVLMEVASFLDYWSLLCLELVSERCRDAVALHIGRVSVFDLTETGTFWDGATRDPGWKITTRSQKTSFLSRLTRLRQLWVTVSGYTDSRWVQEMMLTASTGWSRLETLTLNWFNDEINPTLLGQLCTNCTRLTNVTLRDGTTDDVIEAVLTARCGELRNLHLWKTSDLLPDRLAASLAGCVRLERLVLLQSGPLFVILPPGGLPSLRQLLLCFLTSLRDADLECLAERQPGLEEVQLSYCEDLFTDSLTSTGLASLGRLPALRSLLLFNVPGLSDSVLDQLSKAPLTDLLLGDNLSQFWKSVTPEGLLRLIQRCPALRWVELKARNTENLKTKVTTKTIDCQSDGGKQEALRAFEEYKGFLCSEFTCRLSAVPRD